MRCPNLLAQRARVRPRIISPVTGEAVPLDDQIGQVIEEGRYECVGLMSGPGSGKTTALHHLAAVLPPWALAKVRFVDDPPRDGDFIGSGVKDNRLVICAGTRLERMPHQLIYSLALWGQDDLVEYLLSAFGSSLGNGSSEDVG